MGHEKLASQLSHVCSDLFESGERRSHTRNAKHCECVNDGDKIYQTRKKYGWFKQSDTYCCSGIEVDYEPGFAVGFIVGGDECA